MPSDEFADHGAVSARSLGGSPVKLHPYVDDVDAALKRALAPARRCCAKRGMNSTAIERRSSSIGLVIDPFRYSWFLGQCVEEVSPEEMQRRWTAMMMG